MASFFSPPPNLETTIPPFAILFPDRTILARHLRQLRTNASSCILGPPSRAPFSQHTSTSLVSSIVFPLSYVIPIPIKKKKSVHKHFPPWKKRIPPLTLLPILMVIALILLLGTFQWRSPLPCPEALSSLGLHDAKFSFLFPIVWSVSYCMASPFPATSPWWL